MTDQATTEEKPGRFRMTRLGCFIHEIERAQINNLPLTVDGVLIGLRSLDREHHSFAVEEAVTRACQASAREFNGR